MLYLGALLGAMPGSDSGGGNHGANVTLQGPAPQLPGVGSVCSGLDVILWHAWGGMRGVTCLAPWGPGGRATEGPGARG